MSCHVPFFGGLTATDLTAMLHDPFPDVSYIYHLDSVAGTLGYQSREGDFQGQLPLAPMLGTIGVAPAANEARTSLVPGPFGGNMDCLDVRSGTTVYLGVNVEGALLSIGDGHYRQGEGEACGSAIEGSMNSVLVVELLKGVWTRWPRMETDTHWSAVGSRGRWRTRGGSARSGWCAGSASCTGWTRWTLPLLSQISQAPLANVVDANYSVVAKVPKALLPAATAYRRHARAAA